MLDIPDCTHRSESMDIRLTESRLRSPTWTAFIRRQLVLGPHSGCCYFFRNCFRDGNSIKVTSIGSTKHACWTSQIVLTGVKAWILGSLRAGSDLPLELHSSDDSWSLVPTVDAATSLETVLGMATQSKWEVDTILIYHSKFIGNHMHWISILSVFIIWQLVLSYSPHGTVKLV